MLSGFHRVGRALLVEPIERTECTRDPVRILRALPPVMIGNIPHNLVYGRGIEAPQPSIEPGLHLQGGDSYEE